MKGSNKQLKKWLDEVGIILGKWLFKESGEFRYPAPPQSVIAPTITTT